MATDRRANASIASPVRFRDSGRSVGLMTRIALALGVAVALAGCASGGSQQPRAAAPESTPSVAANASTPPSGVCRTTYPSTPLPKWARTGFSEAEPSVPHVLGDNGDMIAIVWVARHPLSAPPSPDTSNKILWVARIGAGDGPLEIRATSEDSGRTVRRTMAAPGPSIIDLPSPGCWSFDLGWGRHHDHLQLGYVAGHRVTD